MQRLYLSEINHLKRKWGIVIPKMAKVVNPKVEVVDYGPHVVLPDGREITPDEFVWAASGVTYKDMGVFEEFYELKKAEADFGHTMVKSLIKSAGAGHASMATTPGMWIVMGGDSSKLVDSIFTGARYSSSLMPSSRRVPISKENIVVPKGIDSNGKAREMYVKAMEDNIDAYDALQKRAVPKEEAAKIVPYGHKGGGIMFMPLETLVYFSRESERVGDLMPEEGRQIIQDLEKFVKSHGMGVTYAARMDAPRTTGVNPSIFHLEENAVHNMMAENYMGVLDAPVVLDATVLPNTGRDLAIKCFSDDLNLAFANPSALASESPVWPKLIEKAEELVAAFNETVNVKTLVNTPWRVWGEVKRHRTMGQSAESIYDAIDRADLSGDSPEKWARSVSMPASVLKDDENRALWINRFKDSLEVYHSLVEMGIKRSDAVAVVPRGLKLGVLKSYDLYNLSSGYTSLRLCSTAESEMRAITAQEMNVISSYPSIVRSEIPSLMIPKCHYTGFCPDAKFCKNVINAVPGYNAKLHEQIAKQRAAGIKARLL